MSRKTPRSDSEGLRSRLQETLAPLDLERIIPQDRVRAARLSLRFQQQGYSFSEADRAVGWLYGVAVRTVRKWRQGLGYGHCEDKYPPVWARGV